MFFGFYFINSFEISKRLYNFAEKYFWSIFIENEMNMVNLRKDIVEDYPSIFNFLSNYNSKVGGSYEDFLQRLEESKNIFMGKPEIGEARVGR